MESKEPSEEKMIEAVKKYYGLKIDGGSSAKGDVYAYEATTADGYSVNVVSNNSGCVSVGDDIYYTDNDVQLPVAKAIMEKVRKTNGGCTLCADVNFLEDIYFNDVLFDEFSDYTNGIAHKIYNKIINDNEDFNFDDAETLWLKEEYSR